MRSLVYVVRLVEGDKLQFLLLRVALPSKLSPAPLGVPSRASAMIQLDPHEENYFSSLEVSFSHTLLGAASEIEIICTAIIIIFLFTVANNN